MISAWPGIICTISSMIRNEERSRNRNRATATDASSDSTEATSTVASVTVRLLRKKIQTGPIPDAWPLMTWLKLPQRRVGRQQARASASRSPATA